MGVARVSVGLERAAGVWGFPKQGGRLCLYKNHKQSAAPKPAAASKLARCATLQRTSDVPADVLRVLVVCAVERAVDLSSSSRKFDPPASRPKPAFTPRP